MYLPDSEFELLSQMMMKHLDTGGDKTQSNLSVLEIVHLPPDSSQPMMMSSIWSYRIYLSPLLKANQWIRAERAGETFRQLVIRTCSRTRTAWNGRTTIVFSIIA